MSESKTRVLVLDDDARLRDLLNQYLSREGYTVKTVATASEMDRYRTRERYDILILDWMMPGEDGLSICKRLRASNENIPIIMLTAKGDELDRIVGLETGADDYLPKPFNPRELLARIQGILRRRPTPPPPGAPTQNTQIVHFGEFCLNMANRSFSKNNQEITLTSGEFSLLKVLTQNPRTPLSRDKLMEMARGREFGAFDRSIDVQVSRLRKMIEQDPTKPSFIQTVWGFGYVFIPEGKSNPSIDAGTSEDATK